MTKYKKKIIQVHVLDKDKICKQLYNNFFFNFLFFLHYIFFEIKRITQLQVVF